MNEMDKLRVRLDILVPGLGAQIYLTEDQEQFCCFGDIMWRFKIPYISSDQTLKDEIITSLGDIVLLAQREIKKLKGE